MEFELTIDTECPDILHFLRLVNIKRDIQGAITRLDQMSIGTRRYLLNRGLEINGKIPSELGNKLLQISFECESRKDEYKSFRDKIGKSNICSVYTTVPLPKEADEPFKMLRPQIHKDYCGGGEILDPSAIVHMFYNSSYSVTINDIEPFLGQVHYFVAVDGEDILIETPADCYWPNRKGLRLCEPGSRIIGTFIEDELVDEMHDINCKYKFVRLN